MKNKNLRRVSVLVTAQTAKNLERLAQMDGQSSIGGQAGAGEDDLPPPAGECVEGSLYQPVWEVRVMGRPSARDDCILTMDQVRLILALHDADRGAAHGETD